LQRVGTELIESVAVQFHLPDDLVEARGVVRSAAATAGARVADHLRRFVKSLERRHRPHVSAHYEWSIGIYEGTTPWELAPSTDSTNPVLTAADVTDIAAGFVADPFVARKSDRWHMFFEVMNTTAGRGEIGWATSADFYSWTYQQIVLREPFHLSYPSVFSWEDEWLMIPESGQANGLRLYRAEQFPVRWKHVGTLLEGDFTDHALVRRDSLWWLFVGRRGANRFKDAERLELYFSEEDLCGPWHAHPSSPLLENDARFSRPAGRMIPTKDGLLRITQDCSGRYGREVNAAIVETMTTTEYRERKLNRPVLSPGSEAWHRRGMHHLDVCEVAPDRWVAAVDGYRRRFSFHWR
jgi:hypothetical protein